MHSYIRMHIGALYIMGCLGWEGPQQLTKQLQDLNGDVFALAAHASQWGHVH